MQHGARGSGTAPRGPAVWTRDGHRLVPDWGWMGPLKGENKTNNRRVGTRYSRASNCWLGVRLFFDAIAFQSCIALASVLAWAWVGRSHVFGVSGTQA